MSVLNENQLLGASGAGGDYEIEQSLRFNDDDGSYLSRTPSVAGNRKTWTYSIWVKRSNLGIYGKLFHEYSGQTARSELAFDTSDFLRFNFGGAVETALKPTQVFRDTSAWYHIIWSVDTTQSTASDRVNAYINGVKITDFSEENYPALNAESGINLASQHEISGKDGASQFIDGYLAEINFIDGQALTPDSFGETGDYGEWKAKSYAGGYGTNGFNLKFENASSLGNDSAGSNNWTPNNLAATDQMVDSPTNNFCTWNPLDSYLTPVLSEGNLKFQMNNSRCRGTIASQVDGKIYFEVYNPTLVSNTNVHHMGLGSISLDINNASNMETASGGGAVVFTYANANARTITARQNGSTLATVTLPNQFAAGDIIAFASDSSTGKVWMAQNNSWLKANGSFDGSNALSSSNYLFQLATGHELTPLLMPLSATPSTIGVLNCGQDSSFAGAKTPQGNQDANSVGDFFYPVPNSYLALCTANLPSVDVIPSENFNTVLYTGNGSARSINTGLPTDLVWIKSRNAGLYHLLTDKVRGVTHTLSSNTTDNEAFASEDVLTSFDSDGFSLTADDSSGYFGWNVNGQTYVAWNWKAGGSASSNTNGSITSSVSANASAGFSIVSYTGTGSNATIGHGLSVVPEMVIVKKRASNGSDGVRSWAVYNSTLGNAQGLYLNATNAVFAAGNFWNSTTPTSSVFSIGSGTSSQETNINGDTYIAYAFHSVESYSKVGSYVGNSSADGTFVYCGFKPAFIFWKKTTGADDWGIHDNARDTSNVVENVLRPNLTAIEFGGASCDFLSNGFKWRVNSGLRNTSGQTYIFYAVAESPFKHTNAR